MPILNATPSTVKAVEDCHSLLVWLIPVLDQFPRLRRHTLGARIENHLLETLAHLTRATYQKDKQRFLDAANCELAVARHLWRAAFELKLVSLQRYQHGGKLINEIGAQIGGWRKQHEKNR